MSRRIAITLTLLILGAGAVIAATTARQLPFFTPVPQGPGTPLFAAAAKEAAQHLVRAALLTPSQAVFQQETIHAAYEADIAADQYLVYGTLDSQNAFSAMLRQGWLINLRFLCPTLVSAEFRRECWKPTMLNIGEQFKWYDDAN